MTPVVRESLAVAARRIVGWAVTFAALVFFAQRLLVNAGRMPHIEWNGMAVAAATGSVMLAVAAIVLSGAIWRVLLGDQGIHCAAGRLQSLFMVAQFGKYLPGNVGQFVGRAVLARRLGIPLPVTLATMATEVLWSTGTALGIAALALFVFVGGRVAALPSWMSGAGLALCFLLLLLAPRMAILLLKRVFPGMASRLFADRVITPRWPAALKVSALYVCNSLCMGIALDWQARQFFGADALPLLEVAGFFSLAWLAGYVLPGAPAGLGVREGTILALFAPLVGEATALALGVTLRVTTTLADAGAFLVGLAWRFALERRDRRDGNEAHARDGS